MQQSLAKDMGITAQSSALSLIREQKICTIAALKSALFLDEIQVRRALNALQNKNAIEQGYTNLDGDWFPGYFADDYPHLLIEAYRLI